MKLLLDECIDRRLARELIDHEVKSNLSFEQNLPQFDIEVIMIQALSNRLVDLKPLAARILSILEDTARGQATIVTSKLVRT